jgi:hypothetical protein
VGGDGASSLAVVEGGDAEGSGVRGGDVVVVEVTTEESSGDLA